MILSQAFTWCRCETNSVDCGGLGTKVKVEYRKHGFTFLGGLGTKVKGEYRKQGFIKVGEKQSAISVISAFSVWPNIREQQKWHFTSRTSTEH